MAKKPKGKPPARQRDSADGVGDDKKPRGKPVSLFPLTFDEAMRRLVKEKPPASGPDRGERDP